MVKMTPKNKKGRSRLTKTPNSKAPPQSSPTPEPMTYEEAQRMVQFEVGGKMLRVNINESLEVCGAEDFADDDSGIEIRGEEVKEARVQLPEANFKELDNYNICDAPPRPNAYIRFIEKSAEELDGEVEYDVDEEDTTWLSIINQRREEVGLSSVSVDSLELLMDRLEKESYFQASANGQSGAIVDDDAVCCICMDGECQNTNVILFCDMCNLAVHQDCYGVPYIPEGQWLCRRCIQSPSRAVDCVLCPNQAGAFKQTDRGQWAHVVCALWIPEVRFANTVFLEPIDSIETIPAARWRLTCYVCKQRGVGACIQCHKTNCYAAFHVTCAQQAGLYMNMDTVKESENESQPVVVQKIAYCDSHAPADYNKDKQEDKSNKIKNARKMLAKKRTNAPVILIPTIPPEKIQEIASLVTIQKKSQFIQRLIAYWTLKRQFRNGVPLLRRLQSAHGASRDTNTGNIDTIELCRQLKYWQCLRQDLERARLLCELVRKREKLKLEMVKATERCLNVQFRPLQASLKKLIDVISSKDTQDIFGEPVDLEEVPDYTTIVKHPMDISTMRQKLDNREYDDVSDVEKDFDLMIANCLAYNDKDTVFYKAGVKMRDQCSPVFKQARKELEECGLRSKATLTEVKDEEVEVERGRRSKVEVKDEKPANKNLKDAESVTPAKRHSARNIAKVEKESSADVDEIGKSEKEPVDDVVTPAEVDKEFAAIKAKIGPESVPKLELLLKRCQRIRHGMQRISRMKTIRAEIMRLKKLAPHATDSSQSDAEDQIESKANVSGGSTGTSPSGVNRRTAVLLTRKAQAALKKPIDEKNVVVEEAPVPVVKRKKGRPRKIEVNKPEEKPAEVAPKSKSPEKMVIPKENVPDSFRVYRAGNRSSGEENESDSGTSLSTCYSHELSEIDTDDSDSSCEEEEEEEDNDDKDGNEITEARAEKTDLKPLQLVWAKCRGYPWYPALIIDPKMPKGYEHNGVPLPSPPQDVLSLRSNHTEHVYLVLFFDAKRTWQWLPAEKLEILNMDMDHDEAKLNEPRKPADKKAVKKAYENALHYVSQIKKEAAGAASTRRK